jgi:hypothetical protein
VSAHIPESRVKKQALFRALAVRRPVPVDLSGRRNGLVKKSGLYLTLAGWAVNLAQKFSR